MEYDSKADIWSLGITALEMADGKPPYSGIQSNIVVFRITTKTPPFFQNPNDWSPTFTDFVMKCLQKNPGNRSEASEMMEHDFIKDAEAVNGLDHLLREALANKPNDEELNCVEHLKRWLVGKYGLVKYKAD